MLWNEFWSSRDCWWSIGLKSLGIFAPSVFENVWQSAETNSGFTSKVWAQLKQNAQNQPAWKSDLRLTSPRRWAPPPPEPPGILLQFSDAVDCQRLESQGHQPKKGLSLLSGGHSAVVMEVLGLCFPPLAVSHPLFILQTCYFSSIHQRW